MTSTYLAWKLIYLRIKIFETPHGNSHWRWMEYRLEGRRILWVRWLVYHLCSHMLSIYSVLIELPLRLDVSKLSPWSIALFIVCMAKWLPGGRCKRAFIVGMWGGTSQLDVIGGFSIPTRPRCPCHGYNIDKRNYSGVLWFAQINWYY